MLSRILKHKGENSLLLFVASNVTTRNDASLPIIIIVALIASLLGQTGFTSSAFASAQNKTYACGTRASNPNDPTTWHCYGGLDWAGTTNGVKTSIFTNQITTPNCHMNNEVWLIQVKNPGIVGRWIEAGIKVDPDLTGSSTQNLLFWMDIAPNGAPRYHYGPYFQGNDYGKYANVELKKIGGSQFSVSISGLPSAFINANSPNDDNFAPNHIQIGMELCGTGGAYAPRNGFTNNQYLDAHNGTWYYQSLQGVAFTGRDPGTGVPSQGFWTNSPQGTSNHGGLWTTCIDVNC